MLVDSTTIFRASVRQDPQHRQVVLLVERQHFIVEKVSGGDRRLRAVELGVGDLGIGIHVGLLVDAPHALQRADIERILRTKVARMRGINLTAGFVILLLLLKRLDLGLGKNAAFLSYLGFQRFQSRFEVGQIMP